MPTNRQFSMTLQALTELKTDTSTPPPKPTGRLAPALSDVLAEIGSLPAEALFLGVASDGLPVLLNLYDSHPGSHADCWRCRLRQDCFPSNHRTVCCTDSSLK